MSKSRLFENFNGQLFFATLLLTVVGLINLYSALSFWGERGNLGLFWNQCIWFTMGFLLMILFMTLDYHVWEKWGLYFYGLAIFSLILVLLAGKTVAGHKSWLGFGSIQVQPSEFTKLAIIFILAFYFNKFPNIWGFTLRSLFRPLLLVLLPITLVLAQKDLGGALFYPLIFVTVAAAAKIQRKTLLIVFCLASILGVGAYRYVLKPYQKDRVRIFLNPESDPKRSGYHLVQSKIAVGSGGIFGKGYLKGKINKLRYLPDKHTDFIFPVLAEEWGFVGSAFTMGLFAILLWQGFGIAQRAKDPFGAYLAIGVTSLFFWHILINLGGVLGLIPLTGVPLPFLSYGGSSTLTFFMGIGLLMNVHIRRFMF